MALKEMPHVGYMEPERKCLTLEGQESRVVNVAALGVMLIRDLGLHPPQAFTASRVATLSSTDEKTATSERWVTVRG